MGEEYERIPFGVIILRGYPLTIEYLNDKVKQMFTLNEEFVNKSMNAIQFLKQYSSVILYCYNEKIEKRLSKLELLDNKFFTVIISGKDNCVEIYLLETTEEVIENRRKLEYNDIKLANERKKFASISTELKAKCEIIEILREREKEHLMHLKDVINNISEGLLVIDNKGKINLCNRAVKAITDLSSGEILNTKVVVKKYYVIDVERNRSGLRFIQENIFKNHTSIKNYVVKLIDKNTNLTRYIEVSSNPIYNIAKELVYTIVTLKDVTEAKIHQINAEEQANFVKDVVNNLDVPIAVVDYPELTYKLMNKKHNKMFEPLRNSPLDLEQFIGQTVGGVLDDYLSKDLYSIMKRAGSIGKEYSLSPYTIIDEDGSERLYKFKVSPYKDIENKVTRIHIHGLDITDELNHSRELEKITKLKDEFFTVISHELRTPLTIIYSSLQLAYDIYKEDITPNIDKALSRINQNCSRLLKLINNILDISKAEAGFLTLSNNYFDIVSLTEDIVGSVNLHAKSKGIELIFDTNEEECIVSMDKDKYERILLNLMSNSIKFTPEGKQVMVVLHIEKENVTLKVIDQGIGIPPSKINYIFDRFAQVNNSLSRRAEGTGIGLSLVKNLVEYMDGTISVASEEGIGSEFLIRYNKINMKSEPQKEVATIDATINYKVNIEFSDIN